MCVFDVPYWCRSVVLSLFFRIDKFAERFDRILRSQSVPKIGEFLSYGLRVEINGEF